MFLGKWVLLISTTWTSHLKSFFNNTIMLTSHPLFDIYIYIHFFSLGFGKMFGLGSNPWQVYFQDCSLIPIIKIWWWVPWGSGWRWNFLWRREWFVWEESQANNFLELLQCVSLNSSEKCGWKTKRACIRQNRQSYFFLYLP